MARTPRLCLGAVLWRRWRSSAGLTQAEAAIRIAVDPPYLAKIEQGRRKPGRSIAVRMEEVTGGVVGVSLWDRAARKAG